MAVALPCIAQFVLVLDVTIVAIALPAMQADLALSTTALGWVVTAYTLAFGCCLLAAGRLADRVGRRRGFVAGLVLFAAASLACGLAPSGGALLAARAVQGLGAAIASPAALALVTAARPEARGRARALGWWTAAAAGGGASGWVLGGLLTGVLDWRWVFLVNVPLCAAAAALAPIVLRERRDPSPGRSLRRTLLARPGVAGPNVVAAVITATTTPPLFLCTLHVQNVLGLAPGAAGLLFPPVNLAVVAGSLAGPRVAAAVGERRAMTGGLLAVAAGALALLAIAPSAPALPSLLGGFVLLGSGLGVASVASTLRGTAALDAADQGLASGLLATSAQVGTALGLAIVVPVAAARTGSLGGGPDAEVAGFELGFLLAAALAAATALAIESAAVDRLVGRRLRVARERRARARDRDHADRDRAGQRQPLVEDEESEQRGDRRLQAHDQAEQRGRQAPQRDQLEHERQQRDQQGEPDPRQHDLGLDELGAGGGNAGRQRHEGGDAERDGESLEPGPAGADALREQYVARPARRRHGGQRDAGRVERLPRAVAERQQRDAGSGEHHPRHVARMAGAGERDPERPEELDRHGDAERDPRDRLEERQRQEPRARAERHGCAEVGAASPAHAGAHERPQDERREHQPQRHEAGRADAVEQRLRQRCAELDRRHRGDRQRDAGGTAGRGKE